MHVKDVSAWLSCEAASATDARSNWERQTGRCRPGAESNEPTTTTTTEYWSVGCTRGCRVNARVSDNYYQTGCVARPDVQISIDAYARLSIRPSLPPPIHLDSAPTRQRIVRPCVKATTSATCSSCTIGVTLRYPLTYFWCIYAQGQSVRRCEERRRVLSQSRIFRHSFFFVFLSTPMHLNHLNSLLKLHAGSHWNTRQNQVTIITDDDCSLQLASTAMAFTVIILRRQ